jgi:hypothetical protein
MARSSPALFGIPLDDPRGTVWFSTRDRDLLPCPSWSPLLRRISTRSPSGASEARRLGGVRPSEIVDLDQVQANWRDPKDFRLGRRHWMELRRDDDRPRSWEPPLRFD